MNNDLAILDLGMNSAPVREATADLRMFNDTAKKTEAAGASVAKAGQQISTVAKKSTIDMKNLDFQVNDVATGLLTGQSPFMIIAQQGGQLSQVLAGQSLKSAITGFGESILGLVNPITIGFAAIVAGGYAIEAIFSSLHGDSETLEDALKRHSAVVATLKDSYGEAASGLQAYANESRNVVDALSRFDQIHLRTQLTSLSKDISEGLGPLQEYFGPKSGGRMDSILAEFQAFGPAIEQFRSGLKAGQPDVLAFRSAVADLANLDPTNEALQTAADKLLTLTEQGGDAQRAILGISGAMTSLAEQTATAIGKLEDLARAMPSAQEQADAIYHQGLLAANTPGERASVEASYLSTTQRIADQQAGAAAPIPRRPPNLLEYNPATGKDYGIGGTGGKSQAERDAERQAKAIDTVKTSLTQQLAALTMTNREQDIANALIRAHVDASSKDGQAITDLAGKLYDQRDAIEKTNEAIDEAKGLTKDFLSTLQGDLQQGEGFWKSFGDAALNVLQSIIAKMEDAAIDKFFDSFKTGGGSGGGSGGGGIGSIISSVISAIAGSFADGAAFSGGQVHAFAGGGIVSSPTVFRMANGLGIMGEAGAEAVMPLRRGSNGRLGVENHGGGGANVSMTMNINLTGANGDETIRRIADQAAAEGAQQAVKQAVGIARQNAAEWVVEKQKRGEWRR